MSVLKILVNWGTEKIIHTSEHRGSSTYKELRYNGYEEVGSIKTDTANVKVFWESSFFEPRAKYIKKS